MIELAKLNPHPIARAWPDLNEEDLYNLAASIKKAGLKEPVTLDGDDRGLVLDGWQRCRALRKIGRTHLTEGQHTHHIPGASDNDRMVFVLAKNKERRHLTPGERTQAAYDTRVAAGQAPAGPGRPKNRADAPVSFTACELAGDAGASVDTAKRTIAKNRADAPVSMPDRIRKRARAAGRRAEKRVRANREAAGSQSLRAMAEESHLEQVEQDTRPGLCELAGCPLEDDREDHVADREEGLRAALREIKRLQGQLDKARQEATDWQARHESARAYARTLEDGLKTLEMGG